MFSQSNYVYAVNCPGADRMIAGRMFAATQGKEREVREALERYGVKAYGCNLKLAKGITDEKQLVDFFMAVWRWQNYQNEYRTFLAYAEDRREETKKGNRTIHDVIVGHVRMFSADGYSQNAIAEVAAISQSSVNRFIEGEPRNDNRYGQVIETLPSIFDFDPSKWVIKEDPNRTGLYLSEEDDKIISHYYYDCGYSIARIQRKFGYSEKAIKRRCLAPRVHSAY